VDGQVVPATLGHLLAAAVSTVLSVVFGAFEAGSRDPGLSEFGRLL
jgi:hypothetical protein